MSARSRRIRSMILPKSVVVPGGTFTPNADCEVSNGSKDSGAITTQTTYVLRCDGVDVDSVTIDVIPKIEEF